MHSKDGISGKDGACDVEPLTRHEDGVLSIYKNDVINWNTLLTGYKFDCIKSREKLVSEWEDAFAIRSATLLLRENNVILREDAADVRENSAVAREDTVHLREDSLTVREAEIRLSEGLASATEKQICLLQQANANLVIASIEAHKMAEQVKMAKDQLAHLAHHDPLTNLPNRILLQDRLSLAIELAARQGWKLGLMFLDLDRFKHINDSLGHRVGDQLLQSVAQRLVGCARHSDTISRQGGDEFVMLLPFIEDREVASLCAQKMLSALDAPHRIEGHDLHINVSIGISIFPEDGQDAETLIKNADSAMYYAKENGRNHYKFFEQDMNTKAVLRHSIEASLRRAIDGKEFVLHYQPKINLQSGQLVGAEALIRWQHPDRGPLLPAQFISIAEDCGLILPIGRWVLREACLQAQAWRKAGLTPITISINTSALEFRAKDFLENIQATLSLTDMEPHNLELELTESVLMHDAEHTNALLHALSDLGVKLSIDDFGTGYSSLSYLRHFPIDTLKIDQSFVSKMTSNADDASIVCAVINMAKSLKIHVIAEGIETAEQCAFLQDKHCDEGQGYYFGRAQDGESITALLHKGGTGFCPK